MDRNELRTLFLDEKKDWVAKVKAEIRTKLEEFMEQKNLSIEDVAYILGISEFEMDKIFNGNGNVSLETVIALVMGSGNVIQIMPYDAQNAVKYEFLDAQKEEDAELDDEDDEEDEIIDEDYADWSRADVIDEIQTRALEDMCDIDEDCTDDLRQVLIDDDEELKAEAEENTKYAEEEKPSTEKTDITKLLETIGEFLKNNPDIKDKLKNEFLK